MRLIPIVGHTKESLNNYRRQAEELDNIIKNKGLKHAREIFVDWHEYPGYAHYTFKGELKPEFENLSEVQIAIVIDGGFSWFGGYCDKSGLKFSGKIYTD